MMTMSVQHCCRQGNFKVGPELVPHGAALGAASGNGSVGNERQVVAEHGASHHRGNAQRHGKARSSETFTAMGTIILMVPVDVPMAVDMKHDTRNKIATENCAGTMLSKKYAALAAAVGPKRQQKCLRLKRLKSWS